MIKFTPQKHQDSLKAKSKDPTLRAPSNLTIKFVMSYAAALRVYSTHSLGSINILLN